MGVMGIDGGLAVGRRVVEQNERAREQELHYILRRKRGLHFKNNIICNS